jgi:hypothetical protein
MTCRVLDDLTARVGLLRGRATGVRARLLGALRRRNPEIAFLSPEEAMRLGAEGGRAAVAPVIWRAAVGEVRDTTRVTELLGVSRQALSQRVRAGTILGLLGKGTTQFPSWQFDVERRAVRTVVPAVLAEFRSVEGIDPWAIASWATTPQTELGGQIPSELLVKDESAAYEVVAAARHTAARLAE